jgi:pyruvate kinase
MSDKIFMRIAKTKIIATIGPSTSSVEEIEKLMKAGMNAARLNFSHGTYEFFTEVIQNLKTARKNLRMPLAIILDTKGPEIRTGELEEKEVLLKDFLKLSKEKKPGTSQEVSITPASVVDQVPVGSKVLINDGYIMGEVVSKTSDHLMVKLLNSGKIKSNRSVSFPQVRINLPAMTDKDVQDITFGAKMDIDVVAASFIRSAEHVLEIKALLRKLGQSEVLVFSKIENQEGVEKFDQILQVSDGILVARGDLGVELPLTKVPSLQKMMIRKCLKAGKTVVTATQMLESMITNPRPTRAEVSDVANAIYDSSSCIMLSGETACGQYPEDAVSMMKEIALVSEEDFDYRKFYHAEFAQDLEEKGFSIASASVKSAISAHAKAIFSTTFSGASARLLSRFRPSMPIFALTNVEKTYHQLSLAWGVIPVAPQDVTTLEQGMDILSEYALNHHFLEKGDLVVVTTSIPFASSNSANIMTLEAIGGVLVRGELGLGDKVSGKISLNHLSVGKDTILVLSYFEKNQSDFIIKAKGVILDNFPEDDASCVALKEICTIHKIPYLLKADGALNLLNEGQPVVLDPSQKAVFRS